MKVKVAIIGTGPYGISVANQLFASGIDFRIIGRPFSLWFEHTQDDMSIRSDWHTSEIYSPDNRYSFLKFLEETVPDRVEAIPKERIKVDIFRAYLKHVLKRLPYQIENTLVTKLDQHEGLFTIECENGLSLHAENVIIATGIESHKYLPDSLARLGTDRVVHAWDVIKFQHLTDKRILVVGTGQSAAEAICGLIEKNKITWVLRSSPVFFSEPINLPTPVFNFILKVSPLYFFLPKKLKRILAKKFIETTITPDLKSTVMNSGVERLRGSIGKFGLRITETGIIHSSRTGGDFDTVIAATGYRYSLQSIPFISQNIKERIRNKNGIPRLSFRFETSIPNLFMVGGIAEPSHGPALRFIMGTHHAARGIAKISHRFAG